jgi:Ca-activated chloride channel family protein
VEGTYLFPLPEGASFTAFSMHVDGEPLSAEILEAEEARRIYEDIVRQRIDPALLEYVGRGAYRARIFPIPGGGEKRIELAYDEILQQDAGFVRYVYPLNTEKFSAEPLEDVSVQVQIRSSAPIRAVYSPSHEIIVEREGENEVRVIYADEGVTPSEDFVLYYTVSQDEVGIDLLTYFAEGEIMGYYMLLAAPEAVPSTDQVIPKRMVMVFDRSGSMAGTKMDQAREALKFAVQRLNDGDEFNIVDYSTTVSSFADEVVPVNEDTRRLALEYIEALEAIGGTNIYDALLRGLDMMRGDERAEMVVFLTDGKPTIGEIHTQEILDGVAAANAAAARIFVFGVGNEVNTHLLDRIAGEHGGTSAYVKPTEDIEVAVSSFYTKVSSPVLTDLELEFSGARQSDYYPQTLPDLFRGGQVAQLGRLDDQGEVSVELSGQILGERLAFVRTVDSSQRGPEFLPRLWATRKVGFLLDQIRLHGEDEELVDEIVALSKLYGIITPYTSFLIVEDEPPVPLAEDPALRAESGADAVAASEDMRSYADAGTTTGVRSQEVRYVGDKTFFRRDAYWEDSRFDDSAPTRNYQYGSEAYFQLVAEQPQMGRYLALGKNVLIAYGNQQFRIGEAEIETKVGEEKTPPRPESPRLEQNYPNPFNSSTTMRYQVPESGSVRLEVFDLSGQKIKTLVNGLRAAGFHQLSWNGRNQNGEPVSSGVYLARLQAAQGHQVRKILLMK